ncbi:MAG TPA: thiolase family protein [Acidimicrobiia bacterium]|nr:thiolase family protein [Acidimicrobiia bacterium]
MRDVYIAGAGMTAFGKFMGSTVRSLAEEATAEALRDAQATPGDIEMAFFSNATAGILTGQEMIRGQVALRNTGVLGVPIVNVENACASASSAFWLAHMAVASGQADIALAIGSEKLTHPDKMRSFAAIGTAVDLENLVAAREALTRTLLGTGSAAGPDAGSPLPVGAEVMPEKQSGGGKSPFMDVYAGMTRHYMEQSGATPEDFARIAVKNQGNGKLNPKAQYGGDITVEEVLASRQISGPLTLLMCSPIGDGSAAIVLCSEEAARRLGADTVRVRATALVSGRDRGPGDAGAVERAVAKAYEMAGVGPEDLDVLEVHDAAAPAELMIYEELGLCGPGEGPKLLASGETALGGRVPVNPSGGLLAKGHPIGATGCAQLVELADQLRGRCGARQVEGARVALAENGGGFLGTDPAAVVITVLSK